MFWPSVSSDALDEFFFDYVDAPWLDPTVLLKKEKELEQLVEQAKEDPTAIPGMVGSFNTLFPIAKAIEEFIPDIYEQVSAGRFKLAGADSQGGFVIYDGGRWCFSHHAGDPIQGRLTHSFDLVCTHKFGGDAVAMQAWLIEQKLCPDGVAGLVLDKKGNPMATVGNMRSILRGDSRLNSGGKGTIALDAFAGKLMVCGDFPWLGLMDRETLVWTDTDDAGLREFFETEYGMTDRLKLQDALALTAEANKYHPVRSYLNKQVWDGRCRVDTLLVDFLGAEDSPYVRTVTRKALIGALARVMTPGTKHDHVLVLVGPQGCRKSTTISKLGGEWYTDSLYTMNGKEAYELVQGFWIIEVSEMAAARKSDIEQMKQFITKQSDNFRAAYDRRTIDRPRQCAFFGTTNDEEFLKDYTGNRRFWPVKVRKVSEDVFAKLDKEYIGQVWAEVMRAFRAGENWHLDEEAEQSAKVVQDQHLAVSPMAGVVYEFIDTAVPKGWESMPIHKRREWYNLPPQEQEAKYKRTRVCALEIWLECLEGKKTDFNTSKAKEINNIVSRHGGWIPKNMNFGKEYGIQRGWERLTHKHL
jgi:predicted P-loop ATPase